MTAAQCAKTDALFTFKGEGEYRLLEVVHEKMTFIKTGVLTYEFKKICWKEFAEKIDNGCIEFKDAEESGISWDISDAEKEKISNMISLIENFLRSEAFSWDKLEKKVSIPGFDVLMKGLKKSRTTVHRILKKYLQNGRCMLALVDRRGGNRPSDNYYQKKDGGIRRIPGRPVAGRTLTMTSETFECLKHALNDMIKNKDLSLRQIHDRMISRSYTDKNGNKMPDADIPTIAALKHYCLKETNMPSIRALKGSFSFSADQRRMTGDSRKGAYHPGAIIEVDEAELDIEIVSSDNRNQVIGKPILYIAIDVFSSMIIGIHVALENNSIKGISNLLMSVIGDKQKQISESGIALDESLFPSAILPERIRTDHGSEYISNYIRNLNRETGMNISIVPPGSGSLKGIVESSFESFQQNLKTFTVDKGFISDGKVMQAYKNACLTLEDMNKIAYAFVRYYNSHLRDESFPLNRDMIENECPEIPYKIWEYGCREYGSPRYLTPEMQKRVFFALLEKPASVSVSENGIVIEGLKYYTNEVWFHTLLLNSSPRKKAEADIRIDTRSINFGYIMINGSLKRIPLSSGCQWQKSFSGCTWNQYRELIKKRKDTAKMYQAQDSDERHWFNTKVNECAKNAVKHQESRTNSVTGIDNARHEEQERNRLDNPLDRLLTDPFPDTKTESTDTNKDARNAADSDTHTASAAPPPPEQKHREPDEYIPVRSMHDLSGLEAYL